MSEQVREFLTFAPGTIAGDWAWVTVSWLLVYVVLGGYRLWLARLQRRLESEAGR